VLSPGYGVSLGTPRASLKRQVPPTPLPAPARPNSPFYREATLTTRTAKTHRRQTSAPTGNEAAQRGTADSRKWECLVGVSMKPQYRRARTPLVKKVEDLMNVQGIGEKNFLKLKPLITLGQPKAEKGTQHH
jgi:hypothetical protein